MAAVVAVAEAVGGKWDLVCAVTDHTETNRSANTAVHSRGARPRRSLGTGGEARRLAAVLSALGSAYRVQILVKLLEGPGTYRTLQKATRLKAGPLYHHVAQLRLAGLIGPKERDLYELTRGGRNLILVVLTLPKLIKDPRRRPLPGLAVR
jgi:DNA-binding HxlR family transcriptional regulator